MDPEKPQRGIFREAATMWMDEGQKFITGKKLLMAPGDSCL